MKKLTCHCGEVEIQINLKKEINELMRCNCSMCKRKGTMVTTINKNDLKVVKGKDKIKTYQFNTNVAKHFFCTNCGIYTHHNPRSNPNSFCVNFACLEGVDPFELKDIPVFDGTNHPHDKKWLFKIFKKKGSSR